jgi:hypothetical protein
LRFRNRIYAPTLCFSAASLSIAISFFP